jgi:hypothetical protein
MINKQNKKRPLKINGLFCLKPEKISGFFTAKRLAT